MYAYIAHARQSSAREQAGHHGGGNVSDPLDWLLSCPTYSLEYQRLPHIHTCMNTTCVSLAFMVTREFSV